MYYFGLRLDLPGAKIHINKVYSSHATSYYRCSLLILPILPVLLRLQNMKYKAAIKMAELVPVIT